jgi:hypothetical protein
MGVGMKLKMKLMGLAVAAMVTLAGCGGGGSVTVEDDGASDVGFAVVVQGQTGLDKPQTFVIQDRSGWENFWDVHTQFLDPPPALPFIDFRSEMVIGVYLGKRSTPCYQLNIENVVETRDELVVEYREIPPQPNQACMAVTADLLQVIKLPSIDLPVRFVPL